MQVHNRWPVLLKQVRKVAVGIGSPDRAAQKANLAYDRIVLDLVVEAPILQNLVSGRSEHIAFQLEDDVLSSGLLVRIMNEKNLHDEDCVLFI